MTRETFQSNTLMIACILLPALVFGHVWKTIHDKPPEQQAMEAIRTHYAGQLDEKHTAYTRLAHPAKVNERASHIQQYDMLHERISSLQGDLPPTVAGDQLIAQWSQQTNKLRSRIKTLTHELDQEFVMSELHNLRARLTPLPEVRAQYELAIHDLQQAAGLYHSLSEERETK